MNLRDEIIAIIERSRKAGLKSEVIADEIIKAAIIDKDIVVEDSSRKERPASINELLQIAMKALEQADYEGGVVVLPSGGRIKRRVVTN